MFNQLKIHKGFMVAMGIIVGTTVGALTGNVGQWIAIGFVVGAIAEYQMSRRISSQ